MKLSTNYFVRVTATGFVILTLLSIPLFWIRFLCKESLHVWMPREFKHVAIVPTGLLPDNLENDPNIERHSQVYADLEEWEYPHLGIIEYFESTSPGESHSCLMLSSSEKDWAYFDNKSGQFVFRYTEAKIMPDSDKLEREVQYYIGPEGISEIPDKTLGRFVEPIADSSEFKTSLWKSGRIILYDKKLRHFFAINLAERIITKGPQPSEDDTRQPIERQTHVDRLKRHVDLNARRDHDAASLRTRTTSTSNVASKPGRTRTVTPPTSTTTEASSRPGSAVPLRGTTRSSAAARSRSS